MVILVIMHKIIMGTHTSILWTNTGFSHWKSRSLSRPIYLFGQTNLATVFILFFIFIFFYKITRPLQSTTVFRKRKTNFGVKKKMLFARKEDHSLLTLTCIGATIRIGREIQCLPCAVFFFFKPSTKKFIQSWDTLQN